MAAPFERSVNLETAEASIFAAFKERGIHWNIEDFGSSEAGATRCILANSQGQKLATGLGKGDAHSRRIGSLYEAAEHYFSEFSQLDSKILALEFCRDLPYYSEPGTLIPLAILQEQPNQKLPLVRYKSLFEGSDHLYPLALMCPSYADNVMAGLSRIRGDTFDYSRLQFYSSNSGTAIGHNKTDSVIHGLMEAVERDTVSKFLVGAFLLRNRHVARRICLESLPDALKDLVQVVEAQTGCAVWVVQLKNASSIPVYCTAVYRGLRRVGLYGFGCSLSHEHALRRSLHEFVQAFHAINHVYPEDVIKQREHWIFERVEKSPFHRRCVEFDIPALIDILDLVEGDFDTQSTPSDYKDCDKYLDQAVSKLLSSVREVYTAELHSALNVSVTHTVLQLQDHTFVALQGGLVAPQINLRSKRMSRIE